MTFDSSGYTKQKAFLAAYSQCGMVYMAARAAKVSKTAHYEWLKSDPEYANAFELAKEQAATALEDEAIRRARFGVRRPVLYKGKPVFVDGQPVYEIEYSDTLMQLLLKGAMPDKYRERLSAEIGGAGGGPLSVEVTYVNAPSKT